MSVQCVLFCVKNAGRNATQRSDDSLNTNLEHLERRIWLTPTSGSNADNEMLPMRTMLKTMFTQLSPTPSRPKTYLFSSLQLLVINASMLPVITTLNEQGVVA
jgi:hypothetical protein